MNEYEIGDHKYQIGKLDALKQFDVARKLSAVLLWLASMKEGQQPTPEAFAKAICAMAGPIAKADSDFAIMVCMSVVSRQQPGGVGWAPVHSAGGLMFNDIDLMTMLLLTWRVLEVNRLVDFFSASPAPSHQKAPPTA